MTLPRSERGPRNAERVTRSVDLDAPPADVWDALTEDALLGEWLADEVEIDAAPGGEIVCRYADGEERRGEVELVEEAERLAWSWWREDTGPSRVELVLDAVADGTRLTVIETAALETRGPLLLAGSSLRLTGLGLAAPAGRSLRVAAATTPRLAGAAGLAHRGIAMPRGAEWVAPLGRLRAAVHLVLA